PWVTLKSAGSLDGRTALASGASRWVTGEAARADVQRLRARASAIVTGIGTVLADDPELTVRDPGLAMRGRAPLRVVLDSRLRTPVDARLATGAATAPTLIFTSDAALAARGAELAARGVGLEALPQAGSGLELAGALARLAALECNEVLVEAGPQLAGAFLGAGLVDEWVLYVASKVMGDGARPLLHLASPERMSEAREFVWREVRSVGADLRLTLRPK
ncbi:MAG TPA: RibD family protein, partial [Steroidobacteraceae bacterium]|nr:RibD family protein [Steroidobacteraceae bacterium]